MVLCGSMMSVPSFCSTIPDISGFSLFMVAAPGITCKHDHMQGGKSGAFLRMHLVVVAVVVVFREENLFQAVSADSPSGPISQDSVTSPTMLYLQGRLGK